MHETTRESSGLGDSSASGDYPAERRTRSAGGRPAGEKFPFLGLPMAVRGQVSGTRRTASEARSGEAEVPQLPAAFPPSQDDAQGSQEAWFLHGLVDTPSCCRAHRPHLRCPVSPRLGLEGAPRRRVELPEARTACPRTGRKADRGMADGALVAYKKTPVEPAEMWFSSMKVALCSSRWYGALGLHEVKRRSSGNGIGVIGSPRSVPSPSLRGVIGTAFTGLSTRTTSEAERSSASSRSCAVTCHEDSP